MGQNAQIAEHPLLRVLPDSAGIQNHKVCFLGVLRERKAAVRQHSHKHLTVRHILLTAEGVHTGNGMGLPRREHRLDFCLKVPLTRQCVLGYQYIFPLQVVLPPII